MLTNVTLLGMHDACKHFGVSLEKVASQLPLPGVGGRAAAPGLWNQAKAFGGGQLDAAKSLVANMRGGLGGAHNPEVITGAVPEASAGMARGAQRTQALGNLKTLAPTLAAGAGAAYLMGRESPEEKQQKQQLMMMRQQGMG